MALMISIMKYIVFAEEQFPLIKSLFQIFYGLFRALPVRGTVGVRSSSSAYFFRGIYSGFVLSVLIYELIFLNYCSSLV